MAEQYRSLVDYAQILAGNREGINLGLDGSIFVRQEATERVFNPPRIGTQGSSIGDTAASTDISAGSDDSIDIAVDGGAVVTATVTVAGLNTGALIAAALETAINTALAAGGQDARVWVIFDGGDDHYEVYSQSTGVTSSVVITNAGANNVADDLLLGIPNSGTEAVGTDDQDFLLYTTGGPTFDQPVESNAHRVGRFHNDIIRAKKVAEFDIDTMINMQGNAGDSLDTAVKLLLLSGFGTETINAGVSIDYTQGLPNLTFSMVRVSTIFGEYYTGGYVKDMTLDVPGDAPGTMKYTGMLADSSIAGIGLINGPVAASADVILSDTINKHVLRYTEDARVMVVKADGRTITAGADGSLTVSSINEGADTLTLSTTIDAEDQGFIVPWHPGAVQQTGRDNIYTDLEGSFKFDASGNSVCATNINLGLVNDHVDLNNCFGTDTNQGFAAGNRLTMTLGVTLDLSNENFGDLVQARKFGGFAGELIIGNPSSGRKLTITFPKWITGVPPIDLPENGVTPVTFEGVLYQSASGARDPILWSYT
jgi:hypothetical protein